MPLLETPGHSQASLNQFPVGSLLLSPGFWCTQSFLFNTPEQGHQPPHPSLPGCTSLHSLSEGGASWETLSEPQRSEGKKQLAEDPSCPPMHQINGGEAQVLTGSSQVVLLEAEELCVVPGKVLLAAGGGPAANGAAGPSPHFCPNLPPKTFLSASDSLSARVSLRLQSALPFLPEDVSSHGQHLSDPQIMSFIPL